MDDIERALDLILATEVDRGRKHDKWEIAYLREEAKKGVSEFGEACKTVFGMNLSDVFHETLHNAQVGSEHAYCIMIDRLDEEDACAAILLADDVAVGCRQILQMQRELECDKNPQDEILSESVDYYARKTCLKLDPRGILCPAVFMKWLSNEGSIG